MNFYQRMGILPLKKRVNRDKCSFATKQRMFGVFAIDEILCYQGTRFPHFMPSWTVQYQMQLSINDNIRNISYFKFSITIVWFKNATRLICLTRLDWSSSIWKIFSAKCIASLFSFYINFLGKFARFLWLFFVIFLFQLSETWTQ